MSEIILATLNARYIHSALGLRYLYANLGPALRERAVLREFTLHQRPQDIAEDLLAEQPRIIGLGVYIWNVAQTTELAGLLKRLRPDIALVLGGPEVSYEAEQQAIVALADFVIQGPGERAFARLCQDYLHQRPLPNKFIIGDPQLPAHLPYQYYTDEDLAHRILYVEASRGCPFRCEFCLSALDKTAQAFALEDFLAALDALWARGARQFKFVDRTFNLNIAHCEQILDFFLARLEAGLFLHFELIPDRLPAALLSRIRRFPPGTLQFEIGIQTFTPAVQARISRRQDSTKTEANLRLLREYAHLHTDLIIGLPGETLPEIAAGFNRLVSLQPHEIQVGILKRLRGAPIARHEQAFAMRYNPAPPYNILATLELDFFVIQRLTRFARYWDLVANSGHFVHTTALLLGEHPFERFLALSDWLYAHTGQTHRIALDRLFTLIWQGGLQLPTPQAQLQAALQADVARSGLKKAPAFLRSPSSTTQQADHTAWPLPPRQARFQRT